MEQLDVSTFTLDNLLQVVAESIPGFLEQNYELKFYIMIYNGSFEKWKTGVEDFTAQGLSLGNC